MFKKKPQNQLPVPPKILASANSVELLRAWVADGSLVVSIGLPDSWEDPAAYGIFLADLVRHGENIYADKGIDPKEAQRQILDGLNAEIDQQSSEVQTDEVV